MESTANVGQPREVEASHGWAWIAEAFELFKKAPGPWIGTFVVWCVIYFIASIIPGGGLLTSLFGNVLIGGWMLGCHALATGGELKVETLFACFKSPALTQLIIVSLLAMAAMFAVLLIGGLVAGGSLLPIMLGKAPIGAEFGLGLLLGILLTMALSVPVMMATWLAAPLVVFDQQPAIEAMKQSFAACLRNVVPFLIYGLISFGLCIVAALPFLLGFLVLGPVIIASIYTSYRDIFGRLPGAAAAGAG